jgi:hypothetical protein
MKGEIIDPRIVPGVLITLNQRIKYVPSDIRNRPGFDIQNTTVPVWVAPPLPLTQAYEHVPSGSTAWVISRYVENDVIKLTVLVNERFYHCYGTHADLLG